MIRYRILFISILTCFIFEVHLTYGEVLQVDSDFDGKMDQWHHLYDDNKIIKIDYDNNDDTHAYAYGRVCD